jgi:succinylarginine dihydrolase
MRVYELNMDGLVGPTHHYAGLSDGNLASLAHANRPANPAAAALQGIAKMRLLHQMGIKQAVLPPHQRPNLHLLHQLGFHGTSAEQVRAARLADPRLLSACYSASSMWAANTATVSSSLDSQNARVHFTAANLVSNLHRHQEADFSHLLLKRLFHDEAYFQHHLVLPKTLITADEGAANHSRLCAHHEAPGLNLFVYGRVALKPTTGPKRFPARQTQEACQVIARNHQLNPAYVVYAQQHPNAIDAGVFHNDVIATANEHVLFLHEHAFLDQKKVLDELHKKASFPIHLIEVSENEISLADAVSSYLFNSQLVTLAHQKMALFAPTECEKNPLIFSFLENLVESSTNPITEVHYLDLKQSMQNGGGPACLRLRVPLTEDEYCAMHQGVLVSEARLDTLEKWVKTHFRDTLHAKDLEDNAFINECFTALDELTTLLELGSIYPFQRTI